ncbi:MAG TPA: HD domain-containing protein [Flavisolibacter sp.]|nr:HD domain-containing protein [Flavisolibacter sp.]
MIDFQEIKKQVQSKLKKGLPAYLTYHNLAHTEDVLQQAIILAHEEGIVSPDEIFLLKVSALYHDTGFLSEYNGHEEKSCEIAQTELPKYGLTEKQIDLVCGMIRATKIPQNPQNKLEEIICDADLDYLGRNDFYSIGDGLFKEFMHQGIVSNEYEWNKLQVGFLQKHVYFTNSCKKKREVLKQQHLEEVKNKVLLVG